MEYEKSNFIIEEEIIGFDANILVDIVVDKNFKGEIKDEVTFNVLRILTTEIALGEARNVLIKKRGYSFESATKELKDVLKEFSIKKVIHNNESNRLGEKWVDIVKKEMHIKKFSTFHNDCRILSNLFNQEGINIYYTEDKEIKKAVKILKLKLKVRIIPSANNLNNAKIKQFFSQRSNSSHKKHKRS